MVSRLRDCKCSRPFGSDVPAQHPHGARATVGNSVAIHIPHLGVGRVGRSKDRYAVGRDKSTCVHGSVTTRVTMRTLRTYLIMIICVVRRTGASSNAPTDSLKSTQARVRQVSHFVIA